MRRITISLLAGCSMFAIAAVLVADQPRPLPSEPSHDNENAGLARGIHPEILTWDRIYALAVIRARSRRGAFLATLDPAALAQEAARQGITDFARLRTHFHGNGPFRDPGPSVLELERRLLAIDNARCDVAFYETVHKRAVDRSEGNLSGLNRFDVDTAFTAFLKARQQLADEIAQFRDGLDELKFRLGLSPRVPVILDRQNVKAFPAVFDAVVKWKKTAERTPAALPELMAKFPDLGDVIVNGAPILARIENNPDRREEVLADAAQVALKSRSERDEVPTQPNSGVQLELQVRRRIRGLVEKRIKYRAEKQRFEQAIRLKDLALEHWNASPSPVATPPMSQLKDVIEQETQFVGSQNRLVALWTSFRSERLALYHDLGVLPHNDWKSFYADLSAEPVVAAKAVSPAPGAAETPRFPRPPTPPGA